MCDLIVVRSDAEREAFDALGLDTTWVGQNNDEPSSENPDYVSKEALRAWVAAGKRVLCSMWHTENNVLVADFYLVGGAS